MQDDFYMLETCRICESANIVPVLELTSTPMEDQFLVEPKVQPVYPLSLSLCNECGYAFLPCVVDPKISYTEYLYKSDITVGLVEHYQEYAEQIVTKFGIRSGSLAVDLGSNSGAMLSGWKAQQLEIVGVEPAGSISDLANANGLRTIQGYFTAEMSAQILADRGPASVISANYMLANIDDLDRFIAAVVHLMAEDGIFIVQTGYHPDEFKKGMFDYIYHEHFSYFTLTTLNRLFQKHGLEAIDVSREEPKGGSIRVVAQRSGGSRKVESCIAETMQEEVDGGWHSQQRYEVLRDQIENTATQLNTYLRDEGRTGKTIAAFGASHSTTTLLYTMGIGDIISYIVDDNAAKHYTYSPSMHIQVFPTQFMFDDKADVLVLLAWQHTDTILQRHKRFLDEGGIVVVPFPSFAVLDKTSGVA